MLSLAVALGIGASCQAGLVVEAPNITAAPGSSGSFDVLITSTAGSFGVASDTVDLSLTGLSGVSFTNVSIATATPYIYGANSATTVGSTFTFSTFPGTQFETFDFILTLGAQTINSGEVFGLVNVQYSVAANATPGATGTLTFGPDTMLSDAAGNNVDFTAPNGSITISSSAVPEPSGMILLAVGCATVLVGSARRRFARPRC
ncbi:MAG TPA: PEP-CTERM sorting domain-containing protein [Isosphaeraceae bacterium]|nr:PEP-CTERM sorting domain-containing protein [Isosphaeraceae bacterium]